MADILIRMEMPESCDRCVTKHKFFRELKCADLPGMRNFGENRLYTDSRNPYCPLHELPEQTVETNLFDIEEIHPNCTVQILKNSITGEVSVGWWSNDNKPIGTKEGK